MGEEEEEQVVSLVVATLDSHIMNSLEILMIFSNSSSAERTHLQTSWVEWGAWEEYLVWVEVVLALSSFNLVETKNQWIPMIFSIITLAVEELGAITAFMISLELVHHLKETYRTLLLKEISMLPWRKLQMVAPKK